MNSKYNKWFTSIWFWLCVFAAAFLFWQGAAEYHRESISGGVFIAIGLLVYSAFPLFYSVKMDDYKSTDPEKKFLCFYNLIGWLTTVTVLVFTLLFNR
jgi:hypothetical protein